MNPGMGKEDREERKFAERVDDILAGKGVEIDEARDEDYRSNVDFAKKMIECRNEPSPSFQQGLKNRLLSKLAEREAAKARQRSETTSFWDWLRNLVPQNTAWRTVAVTVTVAVLALVVVWRIGVFSPGEGPIVTGPLGPTVSVETRASNIKKAYTTGEEIAIQFSFKNVTNETLTFPFPPEIRMENSGVEAVRTFTAGKGNKALAPGETELYDLTWDQKDDAGKQVTPGDYQIVMPNIQLGEDKGVVSLVQTPTLVILPGP